MPKLFNTIVVYDVYVAAESAEAARAAAVALIRDQSDPLPTSTETALETRKESDVRDAWIGQRPIVGADVSDEDFETLKGKTTAETYSMLYKKPEAEKAAK